MEEACLACLGAVVLPLLLLLLLEPRFSIPTGTLREAEEEELPALSATKERERFSGSSSRSAAGMPGSLVSAAAGEDLAPVPTAFWRAARRDASALRRLGLRVGDGRRSLLEPQIGIVDGLILFVVAAFFLVAVVLVLLLIVTVRHKAILLVVVVVVTVVVVVLGGSSSSDSSSDRLCPWLFAAAPPTRWHASACSVLPSAGKT